MKKIVLGFAITALALGALVAPSSAAAQTITADQIIAALLANPALLGQLQALLGGSGVAAPAASSYTRDLTLGSTGADVVSLQTYLESAGHLVMPVGVAKGYFGALTHAAVAKWQA